MEMQQDERLDVSPPPSPRRRRRRLAGALGVTLTIALTLGVSAAAAESPSRVPTSATSVTVIAGPAAGMTAAGASAADAEKLDAAFAEYRDCMREHGVDLPEPMVVEPGDTATGGTIVGISGAAGIGSVSGAAELPALDAGAFEAADTACSPILEAAGLTPASGAMVGSPDGQLQFGTAGAGVIGGAAVLGGVAGAGDVEAMVAPVRKYAACMREHGVDVPDPVVDEGTGTFELKLDVDPTTADFRAADAACSDGSGFGFTLPAAPVGP